MSVATKANGEAMLNDWSDRIPEPRRPFVWSWQFVSGFLGTVALASVTIVVIALALG